MKLVVTRMDFLRQGGQAWISLINELPKGMSALEVTPQMHIDLYFALRRTQAAPVNDQQIVLPHPTLQGVHVVAWFPCDDRIHNPNNVDIAWPSKQEYRWKAAQLVTNMVATATLEEFDTAIPRVHL